MRNNESYLLLRLKAVASPVRITILHDLKRPTENFPPQVDGDPVKDGICADYIRERLNMAPATISRHLTLLADAGLLVATRKKGWTFYRRDEDALQRLASDLSKDV
jgi:DNA-binding transcriptional ArsR family regulator